MRRESGRESPKQRQNDPELQFFPVFSLWRLGHTTLVVVTVVGSVVHAILIEGTMEMVSKAALCALVIAATVKVVVDLRVWARRTESR